MSKAVSVISGGAGGMGAAIARELGKTSDVIITGRNLEKLEAVSGELASQGITAHPFKADVSVRDEVRALADFSSEKGLVTNVIAAHGVDPSNAFTGRAILSVNAVGTVNMVESFYPIIAEGGAFLTFASLVAHHGPGDLDALFPRWLGDTNLTDVPDVYRKCSEDCFLDEFVEYVRSLAGGGSDEEIAGPCYAASKRFVIWFTQANARRFARRGGARINSISPGLTVTPMHLGFCSDNPEAAAEEMALIPIGRKAQPYEIAQLTRFLVGPGASFVNGVDIRFDGGQVANVLDKQIR